jgi:hypothetical protein
VATDRSVLYVVTDGAASDGGTNGDPLAVQSEQLANIGVEVHVIGVGESVRQYVFYFNVGRLGSNSRRTSRDSGHDKLPARCLLSHPRSCFVFPLGTF